MCKHEQEACLLLASWTVLKLCSEQTGRKKANVLHNAVYFSQPASRAKPLASITVGPNLGGTQQTFNSITQKAAEESTEQIFLKIHIIYVERFRTCRSSNVSDGNDMEN